MEHENSDINSNVKISKIKEEKNRHKKRGPKTPKKTQ
jgi:hypothetical protein